jgi:hypothetical protein
MTRRTRIRTHAVVLTLVAALLGSGAASWTPRAGDVPAPEPAVANLVPPQVTGMPELGRRLTADRGEWSPEDVEISYHWLRDGSRIRDADRVHYRPRLADVGHRLSVRVTARDGASPGSFATVESEPVRVRKGVLVSTKGPRVSGVPRFGRSVSADPGSWSRRPDSVRYRWYRSGKPIAGATTRRHRIAVEDVGRELTVRVTAKREGYRAVRSTSRPRTMLHRQPVRHRVTYRVETRGRITASLATFRRQAQQTLDDPRGWRGSGIEFRRVATGGAFSLVLSEASRVPGFSAGCSSQWSCRVGRYVIINQMRWRGATPMWNRAGRSLRDYRHMVVNHETGHWLEWGHRGCPRRGALAPVMQQQSIDLQGCRPNPWPTPAERDVPRF